VAAPLVVQYRLRNRGNGRPLLWGCLSCPRQERHHEDFTCAHLGSLLIQFCDDSRCIGAQSFVILQGWVSQVLPDKHRVVGRVQVGLLGPDDEEPTGRGLSGAGNVSRIPFAQHRCAEECTWDQERHGVHRQRGKRLEQLRRGLRTRPDAAGQRCPLLKVELNREVVVHLEPRTKPILHFPQEVRAIGRTFAEDSDLLRHGRRPGLRGQRLKPLPDQRLEFRCPLGIGGLQEPEGRDAGRIGVALLESLVDASLGHLGGDRFSGSPERLSGHRRQQELLVTVGGFVGLGAAVCSKLPAQPCDMLVVEARFAPQDDQPVPRLRDGGLASRYSDRRVGVPPTRCAMCLQQREQLLGPVPLTDTPAAGEQRDCRHQQHQALRRHRCLPDR
jgi:hypothetical protein